MGKVDITYFASSFQHWMPQHHRQGEPCRASSRVWKGEWLPLLDSEELMGIKMGDWWVSLLFNHIQDIWLNVYQPEKDINNLLLLQIFPHWTWEEHVWTCCLFIFPNGVISTWQQTTKGQKREQNPNFFFIIQGSFFYNH